MTLLLILSAVLSVSMIFWAIRRLELNEEIKVFLKDVLVWLAIAFSVFLIYYLGGGGR